MYAADIVSDAFVKFNPIISIVFTILRIAVPVVLIISIMITFAIVITKKDEDLLKKAISSSIIKFIAALIAFMLPTIVNALLGLIGAPSINIKDNNHNNNSVTSDKFNPDYYIDYQEYIEVK